MHPRASFLIESLDLRAHPEGGFFREIFRSTSTVVPASTGSTRCAITSMYHLISAGEVSRLHHVASDEIWHFFEGEPLELYLIDPSLTALETKLLGPRSEAAQPVHIVPGNFWQAARPTGAFTLAGCTVGPGFEYEDFTLLEHHADLREKMRVRFPDLATLL